VTKIMDCVVSVVTFFRNKKTTFIIIQLRNTTVGCFRQHNHHASIPYMRGLYDYLRLLCLSIVWNCVWMTKNISLRYTV